MTWAAVDVYSYSWCASRIVLTLHCFSHLCSQHVITEILQVQQILDYKELEARGGADRATRSLVMDTPKAAHLKNYNLSKYLNQVGGGEFETNFKCQ